MMDKEADIKILDENFFLKANPKHTIGLIFDVDELLFDNRNEIHSAYKSLLTSRAIVPEKGEAFLGKDLFEVISNIKFKYNLSESIEELVQERRAVYIDKLDKSKSHPCVGVKELFWFIERNRAFLDIRTAYVTSSEKAFTEIILKKIFTDIKMNKYILNPDRFFFSRDGQYASTCWAEGLVKKPDPILYKTTIAKMGLAPHQCIAFEDSLSGFLSAYKVGTNVVLVPKQRNYKHFLHFKYNELYEGRICKLKSLKDFLPFLENIKKYAKKEGKYG